MSIHLAQRLREAAAELQAERVTVASLLQAHGPAAQGSLLLLMAVPSVLPVPGAGTVLGLGLLAMSWAMWRGNVDGTLPSRVAALEMPSPLARRVLTLLASVYSLAGRMTRARMSWALDGLAYRASAVAVAVMAVVLVLPIPFGNVLPALALGLIGLGLAFRDGVTVLAGLLASAATALLMLGLAVLAAHLGSDWVDSLRGL